MRSALTAAALAAAMLFAVAGTAVADDPAPDQTLPPTFSPPAPAPVIDTDTAAAFAERYAARNAGRFLNQDRRRVRVVDANASCLEHPAIAARFGCVFTLRALVIQRRHGWDGYAARASDHSRRRVRVRNFGCIGALTVVGGETVTPSAILRFVECARIRRDDTTVAEPEPVA